MENITERDLVIQNTLNSFVFRKYREMLINEINEIIKRSYIINPHCLIFIDKMINFMTEIHNINKKEAEEYAKDQLSVLKNKIQ